MTKTIALTGVLCVAVVSSCASYIPIYSGNPAVESVSNVLIERFEERGVSGLEDALYHELKTVFVASKTEQPMYRLSGRIRDVNITTSPVRSEVPNLRAYQLRAKLDVTLTDVASRDTFQTTLHRESDFTLNLGDGDDQVLDTELNRRKALRRLARSCSTEIQRFVFGTLAKRVNVQQPNSVGHSQ